MATSAEEIRKYISQLDKDPNIAIKNVQKKLLTFVDDLVRQQKDLRPHEPQLTPDSTFIENTLDEIEENEQKYEQQELRNNGWEVPLTEEEIELDVPAKTSDFWKELSSKIKVYCDIDAYLIPMIRQMFDCTHLHRKAISISVCFTADIPSFFLCSLFMLNVLSVSALPFPGAYSERIDLKERAENE